VSEVFHTSWKQVFRSVEMAVAWGRTHQELSGIEAIGIDEIAWQRGHRYLTLVYQIDEGCRRLLWVGMERKAKTVLQFFRWFGTERSAALRFICSDMWKPYLKVVARKAQKATHVLDRFHIMSHLSKARELQAKGYEPVLKNSRWLLLKRPMRCPARRISPPTIRPGGSSRPMLAYFKIPAAGDSVTGLK